MISGNYEARELCPSDPNDILTVLRSFPRYPISSIPSLSYFLHSVVILFSPFPRFFARSSSLCSFTLRSLHSSFLHSSFPPFLCTFVPLFLHSPFPSFLVPSLVFPYIRCSLHSFFFRPDPSFQYFLPFLFPDAPFLRFTLRVF